MTSLLEVPAVRQQVHRMSIDEYHRAGATGVLSKDVELLRGIVVTKMPKSPLHEFVVLTLMKIFTAVLPKGFALRIGAPLTLGDSEPEPDISIVQGKAADWIKEHPHTAHLVIEVAISSEAIDAQKADIYAEAGIREYWIIRPEQRVIDVYKQPTREGYISKTTLKDSDRIRSEALSTVEFALTEIFPA
jgi:Uma2 family endonuclease